MRQAAAIEMTRQLPSSPLERHYTPAEIAQAWMLDESTVRRIFADEPGVLKLGRSSRRDGRRCYVSLRIPESVMLRVHRERTR